MQQQHLREMRQDEHVRFTLSPQTDGCVVRAAWLDDYDVEQEVRVSISDVVFSIETRQTLAGESGGTWDTVHVSSAAHLLRLAPTPEPPGYRITAALMVAFAARADIDAFRAR